ncbi:MAG: glycosyltransferase family 39 protein, partial [Chloroflexota bacterium]
ASGAALVGCLVLAGRRAFGATAGTLGALLTICSPFYITYSRLVMTEIPSAALFGAMAAGIALLATRARPRPLRWGLGLGLLLAAAVTIRLSNAQAAPALVAGLLLAVPSRRRRALAGFTTGVAAGLLPLLTYQWLTFGSPLTTGYHLWTPEWVNGPRPQFSPRYAFALPALPGSAVQPNTLHYLSSWVGRPAAGDGGQPVGSPIHASLAGGLALLAAIGFWRAVVRRPGADDRPAAQAVAAFVAAGLLGGFAFYAPYYYQDVRFLAPWAPLWLLMAAAAVPGSWPQRAAGWRWAASGLRLAVPTLVIGAAIASGPSVLAESPLWQRAVERRPAGVSPRLAQARALAQALPPDAWIISAIDGPFLEHHVLRGTARRYVPLARGLEFVDKPPFRAVQTAQQLHDASLARVGRGGARGETGWPAAPVVIDRWSLEFAEALPSYRADLERALAGFDLLPGGSGAPTQPAFYVLAARHPDRGLSHYALRDGTPLRGSAGVIYVYEGGVLRHVPNIQTFTARGLRWEDVRRLPDAVLEAIPTGPPLD